MAECVLNSLGSCDVYSGRCERFIVCLKIYLDIMECVYFRTVGFHVGLLCSSRDDWLYIFGFPGSLPVRYSLGIYELCICCTGMCPTDVVPV